MTIQLNKKEQTTFDGIIKVYRHCIYEEGKQ